MANNHSNEKKEEFEKKFKKEKHAIIEQMLGSKDIGSRLQMFLFTSIDDLRKSTEKSSKAANKLSIILIILTAVIAIGTIIGAIAVF